MSVQTKSRAAKARRNGRTTPPGVAFYDLDGTLMDLNLVHAALFIFANLGEWTGRVSYLTKFLARIPMLYMAERRDRHLLNVALYEAFKGISRDRLEVLGEEYCDRIMMPHMYPRAIEIIEANRCAGLDPVLVTGSPDFIVAPLAERLGIGTYVANRLIYSRGQSTGRLREPVMAGEAKAAWCTAYAAQQSIDLGASWGYADSRYDLPFLVAMGHPVAVNPDRQLRAIAQSRQWPVLRFEKAVKARLEGGRASARNGQWAEEKLDGAAGS